MFARSEVILEKNGPTTITELADDVAKLVGHPMLPLAARSAMLGIVSVLEQQAAAIQALREAARPCPCEREKGETPLPTITDVFGVGVTGLPG